MKLTGAKKVDGSTSGGIGRWVQELAWRDFYTGIIAHFPRVSMGRPYSEKYSEVVWENHQAPMGSAINRAGREDVDGESFRRWKEGLTGVPIVDAAMRCVHEMGWVHNRARMIAAMYLTKDLMIDWRVGERVRGPVPYIWPSTDLYASSQYFMQNLIDGDLASNNGGWQWCASTGVDPCPYFRIFNPHTQSSKVSLFSSVLNTHSLK
jgi:deoxyribodipyrimidine photo-lyase